MKMKRSGVFLIGLVFFAGFVLASCNRSGGSSKVTNIRYFTWVEEQEVANRMTIAEFEKENPDVKVDLQILPWDQYWQKMQTEIAGGAGSDVFMNQTWYFKTLQAAGAADPLDDLIKRDNVDLSKHNQRVVEIYTENGKLYAMPQDWDSICIVYNKDLFDKYGVPYPDDTLDWNTTDGGSFIKLAQRMTRDGNGNDVTSPNFDFNNIVSYGFMILNSNNQCYWNFIKMNGGDLLNYADPKTIEAIQFLQDTMYKWRVAPPLSSVNAAIGFETGVVAMHTNGNWALRSLYDQCNFTWQVAVLPKGPKGIRSTIVNGIGQSVYSQGKNKDAAWKLVKWFGGEKSQKILAETGTVFTSIDYWQDFINYWQGQERDIRAFLTMFQTADIFIAPMVPKWNEKDASVFKNLDLVFMNKQSAKEAGAAIAADFAAIGN
jgi:multiple sugar transport system substrate-binding protein